MIDLHAHTTESDGTFSPADLLAEARRVGLEALAITDHDTFAGYDQAARQAQGLDLVCGIELSTRLPIAGKAKGKSVHLLGYFLDGSPTQEFRGWLHELQATRRDRNRRMVERLQSLGVDVRLEEVEALGRSIAGRPHFAQLLVAKGYVKSRDDAFRVYLDESAQAYVHRDEPGTAKAIQRVLEACGLPSLAHPVRLGRYDERAIVELRDAGLKAIEAYHSDHSPADVEKYLGLAQRLDLVITGGSDFHGAQKPEVRLGTGIKSNLSVPRDVLERMRRSQQPTIRP